MNPAGHGVGLFFCKNICESLGEFFLSKELSDVLIECQDKMFEAHQVILSASSPVFRGMFSHDLKEKKSQLVEIKDLESGVVSEMLRYIYTGSCVATDTETEENNLDMVADLLEASDKYQMVTLKNVCQSFLSVHLSADNSLKVTKFVSMLNVILKYCTVSGSWRHVRGPGVEKRSYGHCD